MPRARAMSPSAEARADALFVSGIQPDPTRSAETLFVSQCSRGQLRLQAITASFVKFFIRPATNPEPMEVFSELKPA